MKNWYTEKQLIRKTIRLTTLISVCHPAVYKLLDETPLFPGTNDSPDNFKSELENYLDTLEHISMHSDRCRLKLGII